MGEQGKILATDGAYLDLSVYSLDDRLFSDILIQNTPINSDQAMNISRLVREEIANMGFQTITMPMVEKIIEEKLLEYGMIKSSTLHLDRSIFKKSELNLSENARTVLERRYLKKNEKGAVVETPDQMFRRVARHIAKAEKKYGDDDHVAKIEGLFYEMMTEFKFLPNSPTLMNAGRR
ncbi:protein containing Ribonucleotide reductase large subunit, N-terminal domain, partial [sediment metagenome]